MSLVLASGKEGQAVARLGWALGLIAVLLLPWGSASAKPAPDSFADLAQALVPGVVNVSSSQTQKSDKSARAQPEAPQFPPGSPFEDFFKDFMDKSRPQDRTGGDATPKRQTSLGSGFVIDSSGLIVTNNHVIEDADEITVTLHDDTSFKAEVVGRDPKTDVAVLRIKPTKPLTALAFGDSDKIRVGDWVLAIGNPFGLGGTVTAGILSARSREISAGPYDDFLQTDASINRGNSGGPMFDMSGEVIGIATAIISPNPSGGSVGIGFAIPANLARPVVEQIIAFGHPRRGWLGVNIQRVTDEIAESLGLDKPRGALISSVRDGGPAQVGGVQPGDVVLGFDGREVTDMRRLPRLVAETPIDKVVKVTLWRKRKEQIVEVKVGELEENDQQVASLTKTDKAATGEGAAVKRLGLSLSLMTPELRERFSLHEGIAGVVVTEVAANSPAADKDVHAGDVIVEVAEEEVKSPEQIAARIDAAKKSGRKSVLLLVDRQGDLRFVPLKLDQS